MSFETDPTDEFEQFDLEAFTQQIQLQTAHEQRRLRRLRFGIFGAAAVLLASNLVIHEANQPEDCPGTSSGSVNAALAAVEVNSPQTDDDQLLREFEKYDVTFEAIFAKHATAAEEAGLQLSGADKVYREIVTTSDTSVSFEKVRAFLADFDIELQTGLPLDAPGYDRALQNFTRTLALLPKAFIQTSHVGTITLAHIPQRNIGFQVDGMTELIRNHPNNTILDIRALQKPGRADHVVTHELAHGVTNQFCPELTSFDSRVDNYEAVLSPHREYLKTKQGKILVVPYREERNFITRYASFATREHKPEAMTMLLFPNIDLEEPDVWRPWKTNSTEAHIAALELSRLDTAIPGMSQYVKALRTSSL